MKLPLPCLTLIDGSAPASAALAAAAAWFVLTKNGWKCHGLVHSDVVQVHSGVLCPRPSAPNHLYDCRCSKAKPTVLRILWLAKVHAARSMRAIIPAFLCHRLGLEYSIPLQGVACVGGRGQMDKCTESDSLQA